MERLGSAFLSTPFVVELVQLLKEEGSLSFGQVNDWIHSKCDDVPLPYRWDLKKNTHILYDWLSTFASEISWDRPRHSQILRWKAK